MDETIIEEWAVIDRWWTDKPIRREFKVLADEKTWVRERIGDDDWSDWKEFKLEERG